MVPAPPRERHVLAQRVTEQDAVAIEVDVSHLESADLSAPHGGETREHDGEAEPAARREHHLEVLR